MADRIAISVFNAIAHWRELRIGIDHGAGSSEPS